MSLNHIPEGGEAESAPLNENFEFLNDRITDVNNNISSNNNTIETRVVTMLNEVEDLMDRVRPIGQPIPRLDDTIFSDEVRLEGGTVSRTGDYATLFSKYGTTYGTGDGITTFNLPDFRGRALWGYDGSFGTISAGLPNIYFSFGINGAVAVNGGNMSASGSGRVASASYLAAGNASLGFNANRNASSVYGASDTVQPPAIKVRWVTRYK